MTKIGFIGLGTMGMPMALNLLNKGFSVTVYNRSGSKSQQLSSYGAEIASSPADATRDVDFLVTMLGDDAAIQSVYYGASGILAGVQPGQILIDCSTISPALSRQLAADCKERYASFLDAPVTGSKPAAENGTLVFMVGGAQETLQEAEPVLMAMGRKVLHMGSNGNGSIAKLAHNTIVGINAAGLIEGMAIAAGGGLHVPTFLELVESGGAASRQAEWKGQKIINHDYSVQFALALMLKDLRLSSELTAQMKLPAALLEAAREQFRLADAQGHGELDLSALALLFEEKLGRPFHHPEASSRIDKHLQDRRRSSRVPLAIPLMLSLYQWEGEGSFSGQSIAGTLVDLSDAGLQITSEFPLDKDMFVVIHFQQEAALPPMIARIIRIVQQGQLFHYGCLLSGLPPHERLLLESYITNKLEATKLQESKQNESRNNG